MQDFVYKTLRLVRISLLIRTVTKVCVFSQESYFIKTIETLEGLGEFSTVQCKPETKSRVCITVSNFPNPSRVYIRLCKHGKRFLFNNWFMRQRAYVEILSTREVCSYFLLKRLELHSAAPRATLTPLSCSPNFPRAQYLDLRTAAA